MSTAPDFTVKPTITGDLVTLIPATRRHVPDLFPLLDDVEVSRLTGSVHTSAPSDAQNRPWTSEQLEEIYQRWSTADDRIVWVVVENATGRIVGETVLNDLNVGNLSCGFRIWLSGATGRGLGTEATRLAVRHAFEEQGLHRIELDVYAFNPRAKHVYEKVGFRVEGTMREALRYDDEWIDAHLMAMLSTDPRPADGG